jgi:hypothetical protein
MMLYVVPSSHHGYGIPQNGYGMSTVNPYQWWLIIPLWCQNKPCFDHGTSVLRGSSQPDLVKLVNHPRQPPKLNTSSIIDIRNSAVACGGPHMLRTFHTPNPCRISVSIKYHWFANSSILLQLTQNCSKLHYLQQKWCDITMFAASMSRNQAFSQQNSNAPGKQSHNLSQEGAPS